VKRGEPEGRQAIHQERAKEALDHSKKALDCHTLNWMDDGTRAMAAYLEE
jgi:hypothetical protein